LPPLDSFDERLHTTGAGETYHSLSRQYYLSDGLAAALRLYNLLIARYPNAVAPELQPTQAVVPVNATSVTTAATASVAPPRVPAAQSPIPAGPAYQLYQVRDGGEMLTEIARRTLGSGMLADRIALLNRTINPNARIPAGTILRLPPEARVEAADRP
jgi:nucleoid-associated protein YgaU